KQTSHIFRNFYVIFLIYFIKNCCCTSYWFSTKIKRIFRFEISNTVVINYFYNMYIINNTNTLLKLVMINSNNTWNIFSNFCNKLWALHIKIIKGKLYVIILITKYNRMSNKTKLFTS